MLATRQDAVREYALNTGHTSPTRQWILSDYDTWVPNPHYVGPDLGHPEYDVAPLGGVYLDYAAAAAEASRYARAENKTVRVEHYKDRCWVVWY